MRTHLDDAMPTLPDRLRALQPFEVVAVASLLTVSLALDTIGASSYDVIGGVEDRTVNQLVRLKFRTADDAKKLAAELTRRGVNVVIS